MKIFLLFMLNSSFCCRCFTLLSLLVLFTACQRAGSGARDAKAKIDSVEQLLSQAVQQAENPDVQLTLSALLLYQNYCQAHPTDSVLCPEYLFKSAQLWGNVLQRHDRAIADYQKIRSDYPRHAKAPAALFFEAYEWEQVGDTTKAIRLYADFMVNYPEHPLREQARHMIRLLQMTPAELQELLQLTP